jgi:hypothetical protein
MNYNNYISKQLNILYQINETYLTWCFGYHYQCYKFRDEQQISSFKQLKAF